MIYLSHLLPDNEMADIIEENPQIGVESIEFSIGYCLDELEEHILDYERRLVKMNGAALSVHGPFLDLNPASNDSYIRKVTMQRFQEAYQAANRLGAGKIIYHTGFVPRVHYQQGWVDLAVPFWKQFLEDKDASVSIHMENVFDAEYELLLETCERVNHPAFSLCLDLGHANHASAHPLTEWIRNLGSAIGHIHIHDNDGIHDLHLAVGEGNIPWDEVLPALKSWTPGVDMTIENGKMEDALESLAYLKKYGIL